MAEKDLEMKTIDHFEIKEELGSGGMGIVYRAWDSKLHRDVALKVLLDRVLNRRAPTESIERLKQEAKTLAQLKHPNVCMVHEVNETKQGDIYLVMPIYEGSTLKDRLNNPIGIKDALNYAKQIAEGLNYVHKQGIVHRDIKPSNIFVVDSGILIFDFGIAKAVDDELGLTRTGEFLGSFGYTSPEQLMRTKGVNYKTDIWSWGTVLFEMLTGRHPFGEGYAAMAGIINNEPDPLSSFDYLPDNEYYKVLQGVLDKSLAKDFDNRYNSFEEPIKIIGDLLSKVSLQGAMKEIIVPKRESQTQILPKSQTLSQIIQRKFNKPMWVSDLGSDSYGNYADLELEGVIQRFRWIEAGKFWMGSPENEEGRWSGEILHEACISQGLWLADTTCTQALWKAVMKNNPSYFKGNDLPVEMVSWQDAESFIKRLNSLVKDLKFRLPTEAEWEYACRAGTRTAFAYGEKSDSKLMNISVKTLPAEGLYQNAWGIFQMHGNVWEWCEDWYGEYNIANNNDITVDLFGPNIGTDRVLRGGSWFETANNCRSAYRNWNVPTNRNSDIGFRLASS